MSGKDGARCMIQVNGFYFPSAVDEDQLHKWLTLAADVDKALPHVRRRGIAIDGGAHVGLWSSRLAQHFQWVFAFEPMPDNFACLQRNVPSKVVTVNAALGDREQLVSFAVEKYSVSHHIHRGETGKQLVSAAMTTIDEFELDDVAFLKLDVEGCELAALQGAANTIARCRPLLHVEVKHIDRTLLAKHMQSIHYQYVYTTKVDEVWIPEEPQIETRAK